MSLTKIIIYVNVILLLGLMFMFYNVWANSSMSCAKYVKILKVGSCYNNLCNIVLEDGTRGKQYGPIRSGDKVCQSFIESWDMN